MLACKSGYLDLVRVLLKLGASLDTQDKEGVTAFGHAITSEKGENIGLIELLIEKGVDVAKGRFEWASEAEGERRRLRDKKVKGFPGAKGDMGSYSEIHKKKKFYEKSTRHLRGEAKNPKQKGQGFEHGPVGIAIRRKFEVVAIKLLKILKATHKKDSFSGNSYLHLAVLHRNWKVADFLLAQGLDPRDKNNHDKTPAHFCADEGAEAMLKSLVRANTRELNFKKKKSKKSRKKRRKKKAQTARDKHETTGSGVEVEVSIDPASSQNASSKGGFLLSQLSLDPDSQGNKLLNDIGAQNSSNISQSKQSKNLWDDLSADSKLDLKNNLSTDRSTQDLHSVYIQKKELKLECRKLEIKLDKLRAEKEFINTEDMRNSWSLVLERRLSEIHQGNEDEQKGSSAGKLLDFISSQSAKSNLQEARPKEPSAFEDNLKKPKKRVSCRNCLDSVSRLPRASPFESVVARLGQETLAFQKEVSVLNSIIRPKYAEAQRQIHSLIGDVFSGPFELQIYGSFANGLNIPGSDLDMLLIFNNKPPGGDREKGSSRHRFSEGPVVVTPCQAPRKYTEAYFPEISQHDFQQKLLADSVLEDLSFKAGEDQAFFAEAKYLRNAQVPVVKLVTRASKGGFPVDITFHDSRHQGLECVSLVKSLIARYPPLKPLALLLKQLLNLTGLADPYTGGLSSYGLVVMVVAYFQLLECKEVARQKEESKVKGGLHDDAQGKYFKGNRRHSRRGSFVNHVIGNKGTGKGGAKGSTGANPNASKGASGPSKKGPKKVFKGESRGEIVTMLCPDLFACTPENVGALLVGVLYFYGFEFNPNFQKIRISLEGEELLPPIVQVTNTFLSFVILFFNFFGAFKKRHFHKKTFAETPIKILVPLLHYKPHPATP